MNFKKLKPSDKIYLNQGFISNGAWLFSIEFIQSVENKEVKQLKNRITKMKLQIVSAKMQDQHIETRDLAGLVDRINLNEFKNIETKLKEVKGYKRVFGEKMPVAYKIKDAYFDAEYAAAFNFCSDIQLKYKNNKSPMIMTLNNKIVGLIMPLNPDNIK